MKKRTLTAMIVTALLGSTFMTSFAMNTAAELSFQDCTNPNGEEFVDYDHPSYFYGPNDSEGDSPWEFYKIYSFADGIEPCAEAIAKGNCLGVVCKRCTGSTEGKFIMKYDDMFATDQEGEFWFEDQVYQYDILSPQYMYRTYTYWMMDLIVHNIEPTYDLIQNFDMNKDGVIRVDDVVKYNRLFSSTPFNFVTSMDLSWLEKMEPDTFFSILDYYDNAGKEEIWIRFGDELPGTNLQVDVTEIQADDNVAEVEQREISKIAEPPIMVETVTTVANTIGHAARSIVL